MVADDAADSDDDGRAAWAGVCDCCERRSRRLHWMEYDGPLSWLCDECCEGAVEEAEEAEARERRGDGEDGDGGRDEYD